MRSARARISHRNLPLKVRLCHLPDIPTPGKLRNKNYQFFVKFLSTRDNRNSIGALYQHGRSEQHIVARPFSAGNRNQFWNGDNNENNQTDVRGTHAAWVDSFNPGMGWPRSWSPWTSSSWASPSWRRLWLGTGNGLAGLRSRLLRQQGARLSARLWLPSRWLRPGLRVSAHCRRTSGTGLYSAMGVALSVTADHLSDANVGCG